MPKNNGIEVGVKNSSPNSASAYETGGTLRKSRPQKLPIELKERFTAYFMRRYPCIKKLKIGTNAERAYTARVNYKDERNRTFVVFAYTYESLVIAMQQTFLYRGVSPRIV